MLHEAAVEAVNCEIVSEVNAGRRDSNPTDRYDRVRRQVELEAVVRHESGDQEGPVGAYLPGKAEELRGSEAERGHVAEEAEEVVLGGG